MPRKKETKSIDLASIDLFSAAKYGAVLSDLERSASALSRVKRAVLSCGENPNPGWKPIWTLIINDTYECVAVGATPGIAWQNVDNEWKTNMTTPADDLTDTEYGAVLRDMEAHVRHVGNFVHTITIAIKAPETVWKDHPDFGYGFYVDVQRTRDLQVYRYQAHSVRECWDKAKTQNAALSRTELK